MSFTVRRSPPVDADICQHVSDTMTTQTLEELVGPEQRHGRSSLTSGPSGRAAR